MKLSKEVLPPRLPPRACDVGALAGANVPLIIVAICIATILAADFAALYRLVLP